MENNFKFEFIEIVDYFQTLMRDDPEISQAVAAINTLIEFIRKDKG